MKTGRPKKMSVHPTLSQLGITRSQSSQWQKLAAIPKEDFEEALAAPGVPSTEGVLRRFGKGRKMKEPTTTLCPHCGQPWPGNDTGRIGAKQQSEKIEGAIRRAGLDPRKL